jgi:tetratricopeptide (TPR) repeat protein
MDAYSATELRRLVDVPPSLIRALTRAGHIHPTTVDKVLSYTFQDLLVLRMASALRAAKVSTPKITAAFAKIREGIPIGPQPNRLTMDPAGKAVPIRDGGAVWEAQSGQYALPLTIDHRPASVATLKRRAASERRRQEAEDHFVTALEVEDTDLSAARAHYLAALAAHSEHLEARINLGRLLHDAGELEEAEAVYRAAKHASALLSYNLAILLEDLSREEEAIQSYREALALDPTFHDAHFNLSRLYERASRPREALRHLLAYKRHRADHDE